MSLNIIQHIQDLRQGMKDAHIDIFIQPSSDPHLSEYVADRFKGRAFLSGFTGSAGTLIVTPTEAVCYTDGRYFIQAEKELQGTSVTLMKMDTEGYPSMTDWIKSRCEKGARIGLDGRLYSSTDFQALKKGLSSQPIHFITDIDLLHAIWQDRPDYPCTEIFVHDIQYTGLSAHDKLELIRTQLEEKGQDTYVLTSLNDIAWLFNIRANDVAYTPVAYAYAIITSTEASLYVNPQQINHAVQSHLSGNRIRTKAYKLFYNDLSQLEGAKVLIDPSKTNALTYQTLQVKNTVTLATDPTYMTKACLNSVELANLSKAQVRDGVAMVNFLAWLDKTLETQDLSERDAELQLEAFRRQQEAFIEPSFKTIPASGANGAMMHYSTPVANSPLIEKDNFFLLDSGGQYYDGTTDITRTIATGTLTQEAIRDYTLVLKAHIRLNQLTFLKGVTGTNIDIIARQCMWEHHMDYKSGTGHSVGYLLGVHEGPARIRKELSDVVLAPGMILTNEPGVYKEGSYGIRIENTLHVKEVAHNESGTYLAFDVISYCPMDLRCVDKTMLDPKEINWLNNYHQEVNEILRPLVDGEVAQWLENATRAI